MATTLYNNSAVSTIINDVEVLQAFAMLKDGLQNRAIQSGLRVAARPVIREVRQGFSAESKHPEYANQLVKFSKNKSNRAFIAIYAKGGIPVWLSRGTKQRKTKGFGTPKTGYFTKDDRVLRMSMHKRKVAVGKRLQFLPAVRGSVKESGYFDKAVEAKAGEFISRIQSSIEKQITKAIAKNANR